jgi:opacity protein-like surface antigen
VFLVLSSTFLVLGSTVYAQTSTSPFTGFATAFIGLARGGDVADASWTPGASIAVLDDSGLGAEVDLSHVRDFNKTRFADSSITSLMINAIGLWADPPARVRPYVVGGVGLLRARACFPECQQTASRTNAGFDAGGGVFVIFDELIGIRGDVRYFRYLQRPEDFALTEQGFFDFWRTTIGATIRWPIRYVEYEIQLQRRSIALGD